MKKAIQHLVTFQIIACFSLFYACSEQTVPAIDPPYWDSVGDTRHNAATDDPTFALCNDESATIQYFNVGNPPHYEGGKAAVKQAFEGFKPVDDSTSGWVRIRFIVNCEGKTGRFRIQSADPDYKPIEVDKKIADQLLETSKNMSGWQAVSAEGQSFDYYQYLVFKMKNGDIETILP